MSDLTLRLVSFLGIFPSWLAVVAIAFISLFIIILLVKIVGAVLDAIPFL